MSDFYCKGIVRSHVESTNLRVRHSDTDVTRAEFFSTARTTAFFGKAYVDTVQRLNDQVRPNAKGACLEIDWRNPRRRKIKIRDLSKLYGHRPTASEVWHLSPYEFVMYWEAKLVSYPEFKHDISNPKHHVVLTASGREKLHKQKGNENIDLIAGIDYVVKPAGCGWFAFPDTPSTQHFRHTWILARRTRAQTPSFVGSPLPHHRPGQEHRSAAIVMLYFPP